MNLLKLKVPSVHFAPLVNKSKDLTRNMLSLSLLVIHDTSRCGQDDVTELSGWQQVVSPLFNLVNLDIESWHDDTNLIQSTVQLNDNLSGSVVIDILEFANVA